MACGNAQTPVGCVPTTQHGTLATQLDQRQYEGAVEILLVVVPPPGVELADPGPLQLGHNLRPVHISSAARAKKMG